MGWIRRLLPRGQMATYMAAICRRDLEVEVAAHMAIQTWNVRVPIGKREINRRCGVVYGGAQPAVKRMTALAGLGKLTGYVIGTLGLLIVPHVA